MIHKSKSYARLPRPAPLAPQSGLSLVELIISLALGLIITLGVTQIYLSGNDTYRQTQGLAHAPETASLWRGPWQRRPQGTGLLAQRAPPCRHRLPDLSSPIPMSLS